MRLPAQEQKLRTLSKNQAKKAKALMETVKGQRTEEARKVRAEARHLKQLSQKNAAEARAIKNTLTATYKLKQEAIKAERRAEREAAKVRKAELKRQRDAEVIATARTRETDERQRVYVPSIGNIGQFDRIYIDTVMEIATYGQGNYRRRQPLQTPVAKALRQWITETRNTYGDGLTAYVCKKALSQNPYIFTTYIYDSDQTGVLTNDTLFILDSYAREYIENYESPIDLRQVEFDADDTVGTEGIMS